MRTKNQTIVDNNTQLIVPFKTKLNVNQCVSEITQAWRKTAEQFIETAKCIKQIKSQASNWRDIEKEITGKNIIPSISLKQLMAISNNPCLMNIKYLPQLPGTLATIYEASKIHPTNLQKLFEEKKINPFITTKKVKIFSTTLPRRNVGWNKLNTSEKKATSMIVTFEVEVPVKNHLSVTKSLLKEIQKQSDYDIKLVNSKPNFN